MTRSLTYRPEIDGLRCLAVLPVILFHLSDKVMANGYLGVDVFFVISGFLITCILLREAEEGSLSLLKFWKRRIHRILPLAAFVILVTSLVHAALFYHPDLKMLSGDKWAALLSYMNIHLWLDVVSYWDRLFEHSAYLHYWSLAVEEQYYLLYPFFFLFIHKIRAFPVILALSLGSLVLYLLTFNSHSSASFYLLPWRAWELGFGCLLALYDAKRRLSPSAWATLFGLGLIAFAYWLPKSVSDLGLQNLLAVLGSLLAIAGGSNRISNWTLKNPLVTYLGRISYSLYLWHWPVIVTLTFLADQHGIATGIGWVLGASLLLSIASYHLIETPWRRKKNGTTFILGFVAFVGLYMIAEQRFILKGNYAEEHFDQSTWHGLYYDLRPIPDITRDLEPLLYNLDTPAKEAPLDAYREGGILRTYDSAPTRVVLLGDSHGVMWAKAIDDVTKALEISTSLWAMNGQNPFIQFPITEDQSAEYMSGAEKAAYDQSRLDKIKEWNPDIVILAARWQHTTREEAKPLLDWLSDNVKEVLLVESPPPLLKIGDRNFANYAAFIGHKPTDNEELIWATFGLNDLRRTRWKLFNFADNYVNVSVLPTADLYLTPEGILAAADRTVYYLDDDHLTDTGVIQANERFQLAIEALLKGERNAYPIISDKGDSSRRTRAIVAFPEIAPGT
tara:strand:- start:242390 stop:244414 length:2025 start_codon:yes stop_codon:yes gene_type:complete